MFRINLLFPFSDYDKLVKQGAGISSVVEAVFIRGPECVVFQIGKSYAEF
jgi:hypothetical protein